MKRFSYLPTLNFFGMLPEPQVIFRPNIEDTTCSLCRKSVYSNVIQQGFFYYCVAQLYMYFKFLCLPVLHIEKYSKY